MPELPVRVVPEGTSPGVVLDKDSRAGSDLLFLLGLFECMGTS